MESKLLTPSGKEFPKIKYYDFYMASKQIVELYIKDNEEHKKEFIEFSKNYKHFEPYLDFIIVKLHYSIKCPFIDDNGILLSKNNKLYYYNNCECLDKAYEYPLADDISLNICNLDTTFIEDSVVDVENEIMYLIDRKTGGYHAKTLSIILMQLASRDRKLYEDYKMYIEEDNLDESKNINKYFRLMLKYLQIVKYEDGSGHIIYNDLLMNDKEKDLVNNIKEFNPKLTLDKEIVDEDQYEKIREAKDTFINNRKTI